MPPTPDNVIVCLCDQLRPFELSCHGHPVVRTPHIDRLAAGGVRFETAVSTNPVCVPARSALLSGQWARTCTGALHNDCADPPVTQRRRLTDTTLPEAMHNAGRSTTHLGKWHIDVHPEAVGFGQSLYPCSAHRYTDQTYYQNHDEGYVVKEFSQHYEIEQVEKFLGNQKDGNKPFFLQYCISLPHMPLMDAPDHYTKMFTRDDVVLRDNVVIDGEMPFDNWWFLTYLWDHLYYRKHLPYTETLPEGFDIRDLTALYYGMVVCVDDLVGRMMAALEANGLTDNTLVVFTSDHGDILGSQHMFNKCRLWDESIRIPMIMHWPGGLEPLHNTTQVARITDVYPTIMDMCGLKTPGCVQGHSLAGPMRDPSCTVQPNAGFVATSNFELGIRTIDTLYGMEFDKDTHAITNDRYALYDLREDPYQLHDLLRDGSRQVPGDLKQTLTQWHESTPWHDLTPFGL